MNGLNFSRLTFKQETPVDCSVLCGWLRGVHFYFQGFAKGESSNKGALLIVSLFFFFKQGTLC